MPYTPSIIERLQLDIGAIISANGFFANVPVNIVRPRASNSATMIQNRINDSLSGVVGQNGASGATVVVDMPEGEVPYPETPGPDLRLVCKVRVIENPLINMGTGGTLKSAEDLMLVVLNLLHNRYFMDSGSTLQADKDAFRPRLDAAYLEKNYVAYETRFLMRMGIAGALKTPMPGISGDAVSGVAITGVGNIFYTTDGSYPTPTNGTPLLAVLGTEDGNQLGTEDGNVIGLETGTINVASGTLVRAVGYQDNQLASDLAAKIIK